MADISFWKRDTGDDDTSHSEPEIQILTREGYESAINPQTGQGTSGSSGAKPGTGCRKANMAYSWVRL